MQSQLGRCIHGVPLFDKEGKLTKCDQCHKNALGAINKELLNRFMSEEEQIQYGLRESAKDV